MTERMDDWNTPESSERITCIMMIHTGNQNKEITVAAQCSLHTEKTISHELENCDGDYEAVAVVAVGVTAGACRFFSAALAMRMGGARAHQRSSPGRGVDAPRRMQGIGAIDVQTTLLPPHIVGSCPSPTFRSYVASVGGGDGVRSGIG